MMPREFWLEGAWLLGLWTVVALLLLLGVRRVMRRWPEAAYALLQAGFYALPLGLLAYGLRLKLLPDGAFWRAEPPEVLVWLGVQVVSAPVEEGSTQGPVAIGKFVIPKSPASRALKAK